MTSTNVVPFNANEKEPHCSGQMKCTKCGHEWVQVSPNKSRNQPHECPECKLESGYYHGFSPPDDELVFICDCGCQVFYVLKTGVWCVGCATMTSYAELAE